MSVLVWAMMGIASWHLAVLVLDSVETKLRSTRSMSDLAAADLVGSRFLKHLRAAVSEPVAAAQSPPAMQARHPLPEALLAPTIEAWLGSRFAATTRCRSRPTS